MTLSLFNIITIFQFQVVQNLEDSQMKNVLRSVQPFCPHLMDEELRAIYAVVKNEHLERMSR